MLLKVKAVDFNFKDRFTWSSGIKSPIYVDMRILLSYPEIRNFISEQLINTYNKGIKPVDAIAGVATGGIAYGAIMAFKEKLPFYYVRSKSKAYGKGNQIEGDFKTGERVLVIEDTVSTGRSILNAVEALREEGLNVVGAISIFSYDFKQSKDRLKEADLTFKSLCCLNDLTHVAQNKDLISDSELVELESWVKGISI